MRMVDFKKFWTSELNSTTADVCVLVTEKYYKAYEEIDMQWLRIHKLETWIKFTGA